MHDKIPQRDLDRAAATIELIARRDHTTPDRVRFHLKETIIAGMMDPDPQVRETWTHCPCRGEVPTPEEFLLWVTHLTQEGLER